MRGRGWMLLGAAALAGCASGAPPAPPEQAPRVEVEEQPEWQRIAAESDIDRIADIRVTWDKALSEVRTRSGRAAIADEGALLDPDAALPRPAPPPGSYFCRTIKLGASGRGPTYVAYKPFFCFVDAEDDLLIFVKQTGSERPAGRIYADNDPNRLIFVGALALGDEPAPPAYGDDRDRDLVGVVERVGPFRYRLVLPTSRFESTLDVLELVPAPQ